jgi:PLP dependent protein
VPKLNVHVQVNTSGEESKSGTAPGEETVALCRLIASDGVTEGEGRVKEGENDRDEGCPNLNMLGLMTIGAIARSKATSIHVGDDENEDFVTLREQRALVAKELGLKEDELELSMGMSEDFEGAIVAGSSEVRVGSTIFGERPAKADAKITV